MENGVFLGCHKMSLALKWWLLFEQARVGEHRCWRQRNNAGQTLLSWTGDYLHIQSIICWRSHRGRARATVGELGPTLNSWTGDYFYIQSICWRSRHGRADNSWESRADVAQARAKEKQIMAPFEYQYWDWQQYSYLQKIVWLSKISSIHFSNSLVIICQSSLEAPFCNRGYCVFKRTGEAWSVTEDNT